MLDETLGLRDYDLRVNNLKLEREFEAPGPAVTADPHQLEQVFLNIINNAVDAMLEAGKGGTLKVRVYTRNGNVHVEFHDSGPGIKEPHRIFEPFYTTKGVGKGTGLGLSICYGIIQEHSGQIAAQNGANGGGIVEIVLPSAGESASTNAPAPAARRQAALAGRVLLIENESAVLEFERDVLSGAGAEVVTSMNAEEMRSLLRQQSFHAVIIDGKTQGVGSAREVYGWLLENCPGMESHLLFTFSTVAEPEVRNFLQEKNVPCLVKPFEVADLIAHARRLMQKAQAATAN